MGFWSLFVTALMPILKVLVVTGIGLFIALERIDLLGPTARHHLNTFWGRSSLYGGRILDDEEKKGAVSSVAQDGDDDPVWWLMNQSLSSGPFPDEDLKMKSMHLHTLLVFYIFYPALVASNLADTVTASSLATMWFMPVNILLTFIIGSALGWILIKITRPPQHLHALILGCCSAGNMGNLFFIIIPAICEESDNPFGSSDCSTDGDAYASLSSALGAIGVWTYVYMIMRMSATKCKGEINLCNSTTSVRTSREALEISSDCCTEALLPPRDSPRSGNWSDEEELPHDGSEEKSEVPFSEKIKQKVKIFMEKTNFKQVFTPSTIGVIFGFFIGLIPPIRKLIIGDSAPLRVIESSATLLGEAAIPSTTLIMGANLLSGLKGSDVSIVVILGIVAVRYIFLPLLGVVVVKAATHFGLVGSNLLFQFVLMLQYAVPPAMGTGYDYL
ncbi:Protein PIN-likeS 1 [Vitis vinifera]|uniref:Protein PIN-likeS 1 n=1 Tax=Vitis vinifera TaxID=29760 RepID=A0A438D269_VITVI|nr:Protein PIN-likeS 1 [Vitis vinifera]